MPSFDFGKHFPPGPAPLLERVWIGSEQKWVEHPYWFAGKFEKEKHCLGTKASQGALHVFLPWRWIIVTFLYFSIDTGAHTGLV